ncbi:MAG TPA: SRPBCC family protein [Streptosporangiaceae bacterium]|nr:SRPBCC family protein [Streptosporangiaceae bacterium]
MAMELDHTFTVPVPPSQAWDVLLDVQRIAPCMPGATVDTVDGDDVAGRLKVKVGPVSLTYKGTATFKDRDPDDRSLLVEAAGKEMRGAGTASATVRAALAPENGSDAATLVTLHTTLNVTGRPAQFGRGVIAEVGSRLIDKFADNLAQQLGSGATAAEAEAEAPAAEAGAPAAEAAAGAPAAAEAVGAAEAVATGEAAGVAPAAPAPAEAHVRTPTVPSRVQPAPAPSAPADADQEDSLNLLSLAGPVIAKRAAPVVGAVAGGVLVTWIVRRIRRRRAS